MIAINKSGRAPRAGVQRYPGGQIKHNERRPIETPEQVRATALDARIRQNLGVDEWLKARGAKAALSAAREKMDDPLLGYALGRLLLVGRKDKADGITGAQHSAGVYFGWLYRQYAKIRGWPSPNVKALNYGTIPGKEAPAEGAEAQSFSEYEPDTEQWLNDIKDRWQAMYGAIIEADNGRGDVFEALKRVMIEDKGLDDPAALGSLRIGLNAINRTRGV